MKEITEFEGRSVEILRRPRQRHIHLRVRPDGGLRVTCSRRVPKRAIFSFIAESEPFIQKCLRQVAEHRARYPLKRFETGETVRVRGELKPLAMVWSWGERVRVKDLGASVEMVAPLNSTRVERLAAMCRHFQREAKRHLPARVEHFASVMGLRPSRLSIRGQKTRWGSCTAKAAVNLNWKLMSMPAEIIDYVIVHELAHIRHLDHSPRFWALVGAYFPEYARAKRWLREHEPEIAAQFA